jgi:WD40 repeat protein
MSLKATFNEHKDVITGLCAFTIDNQPWLISTSWDRRICIFDLKNEKLKSIFYSKESHHRGELAADGIILDLDYCPERNEIAYASADKQAYIRSFSTKGDEMNLKAVLQGHEAEVTCIKWHAKEKLWITGSEDRTLRLWVCFFSTFFLLFSN